MQPTAVLSQTGVARLMMMVALSIATQGRSLVFGSAPIAIFFERRRGRLRHIGVAGRALGFQEDLDVSHWMTKSSSARQQTYRCLVEYTCRVPREKNAIQQQRTLSLATTPARPQTKCSLNAMLGEERS